MIYFDNNATTIMPQEVINQMVAWCNKGNPSASYYSATKSREMMDEFREYMANIGKFTVCKSDAFSDKIADCMYNIIFTSGASESNCMVISSVIKSWTTCTPRRPHIVTSSIEHKSILDMIGDYVTSGKLTVTYVVPTNSGHILPEDVSDAITQDTCLVSIMHANNETGAINDIKTIGDLAHKKGVPFHTDVVQTYGKFPMRPIDMNVDACSISFHKFGGPPGIGALIIKQKLIWGYSLSPMIYGTQNYGLRGGTENLPGIGAAYAATKIMNNNREEKNNKMAALKTKLISSIRTNITTITYIEYIKLIKPPAKTYIVLISDNNAGYLPNTILLSVVSHDVIVCNAKIKLALEKQGIIISVGSACNTASSKASHVLYAMNADDRIKRGALRISLSENNNAAQVDSFVTKFMNVIAAHISQKK